MVICNYNTAFPAVPARVTLSFTTLVSLTTLVRLSDCAPLDPRRLLQGNGLRYDLPQVSYAKAIDLWYGGKQQILNQSFRDEAKTGELELIEVFIALQI